MENEVIEKLVGELQMQKKRLNPKDEPSTSKIERVTWIFVTGAEAKSQCCWFLKSQNLTQKRIFKEFDGKKFKNDLEKTNLDEILEGLGH